MYIKDIKSKVAKSLIFYIYVTDFLFHNIPKKFIQNLYVGGFLTVLWYLA